MDPRIPLEGGCTCRNIRFRLETMPIFVHCCHCLSCQRETGSAFALNAMIEADQVSLQHGEPELIMTPSDSGKGQKIARCPTCKIAVWSNYAGAGEAVRFVRIGTLDEPGSLPPDIHIYTSSKHAWVAIPTDTPSVPRYYKRELVWPRKSIERWEKARKALAGT